MEKAKLQVIFPGIGYHYDKPLLYYGRDIAFRAGFEGVNHSLESKDTLADLDIMKDVMSKSMDFSLRGNS